MDKSDENAARAATKDQRGTGHAAAEAAARIAETGRHDSAREGPVVLRPLLRAQDVARYLSIGRTATYRLMLRLPNVRIGRSVLLAPAVLEDYIASGGDAYFLRLTAASDAPPQLAGEALKRTKRRTSRGARRRTTPGWKSELLSGNTHRKRRKRTRQDVDE